MNARPVQPAAPHVAKPMEPHMHSPAPVMGVEGVGTEGEDCCHDYMLNGPVVEDLDKPTPGTEEFLNAQALLQGVIYSEILGRRSRARCGRIRA